MTEINREIDIALELSQADRPYYDEYCNIYPWTNEDLGGAFNNFCQPNSKVLTVCSSGDHVLNAVLRGCSDITTFDINKFTFYYLDLKMAAIESFSRTDFLQFMPGLITEEEYMNDDYKEYLLDIDEELYKMLEMFDVLPSINQAKEYQQDLFTSQTFLENLKNISKESYEFWTRLYNIDNNIMDSHLFKYKSCGLKDHVILSSNYLKSDQSYELVKNNLSNVVIKKEWTDVKFLGEKIKDQNFDFIHLSNIANTSRIIFNCQNNSRAEGIRRYSAFLQKHIYTRLNKDGTIILNRIQDPLLDWMYDLFGPDTEKGFQYMNDPIQILDLNSGERIYYKKK